MSNTIIRPKDRAEWLEYRKSGIGSSEVASILGLNPWQSPYQLWRQKKGLDAPKEETFAMKAGHYLEDAVSMFWSDATGREVIKSSSGDWIIVNNERPYLRASPDRTFWLSGTRKNNQNKGILECKIRTTCPSIGFARCSICWAYRRWNRGRLRGFVLAGHSIIRTSHLCRTSTVG